MDDTIPTWENILNLGNNKSAIHSFCIQPLLRNQTSSFTTRPRMNDEISAIPFQLRNDSRSAFGRSNATGEIIHDDITKFGHTTNVIIYSFLEKNRGIQYTREEIRSALENHKMALKNNGMCEQHLTRIRVGKASVNYWIDKLVENGTISKKNSNPVLFWRAR